MTGYNKNKVAVVIVPYDATWQETFGTEKKRLERALASHAVDIQHTGSTSVVGLCAKPLIDIVVSVETPEEVEPVAVALVDAGYNINGLTTENAPTRAGSVSGFYNDNEGNTIFHLHILVCATEQYFDHICIRDYFRAHPKAQRCGKANQQNVSQWQSPRFALRRLATLVLFKK